MIHSIKIINKSKLFREYFKDINFPNEIQFKSGVNVIIGPNGCGKTSLLNIIRYYTFCHGEFYSSPKKCANIRKLNGSGMKNEFQNGAVMINDYNKPIFNLRSTDQIDYNWNENIVNFAQTAHQKNNSTGEDMWYTFHQLFKVMFDENHISNYSFMNELPNQEIKDYYINNNVDDDIFTILMDEPDKSLDVSKLTELYNIFIHSRPDTQLILVLHNPALIYKLYKNNKCNIIEFETDYLQKIIKFIEK